MGHHYVSGLLSHHNNHREDRFRPLVTSIGSSQHGLSLTNYVNNWDGQFAYTCPHNKAIVGMISYHHNHEDRRWRFYCAAFHGVFPCWRLACLADILGCSLQYQLWSQPSNWLLLSPQQRKGRQDLEDQVWHQICNPYVGSFCVFCLLLFQERQL